MHVPALQLVAKHILVLVYTKVNTFLWIGAIILEGSTDHLEWVLLLQ